MTRVRTYGVEAREAPRNLWKDAAVGVAAGALGTLAMNGFWNVMAAVLPRDQRDEREGKQGQGAEAARTWEQEGILDDIALVGPFHRRDESAAETLGRVVYGRLRGREPSPETRSLLASEIHWATGLALGGIYGLLRGRRRNGLDLGGGILYGAGAWLTNDEVLVPVLGLSEGPTAHGVRDHARGLGAHLAFGLATAAATQALRRLL